MTTDEHHRADLALEPQPERAVRFLRDASAIKPRAAPARISLIAPTP